MATDTGYRAARSLADELRAWDDERLAGLLAARPDLVVPVPADLSALANRAGTRPSTQRAVDRLNVFEAHVLEALAVLPEPADADAALRLLTGRPNRVGGTDRANGGDDGDDSDDRDDADGAGDRDASRVEAAAADFTAEFHAAVDTLLDRALIWGPRDRLRLVGAARQLLGQQPAGLGPWLGAAAASIAPSRAQGLLEDLGLPGTADTVSALREVSALMNDPDWLAARIAEAPPEARRIVDRLAWGPPFGTVTDSSRWPRVADARGPVEWLLARAMLVPWTPGTVVLPREVGLHVRCCRDGRGLYRDPQPRPPEVKPLTHGTDRVDGAATAQVLAVLRAVEAVLDLWSDGGPPVLRTGGLGVRELRRTASALNLSETETAFVLELALLAGLLGRDQEEDESWLPTPTYDTWLRLPPARRWRALAEPWLRTSRVAGLVGERDDKDRPLAALGPGLNRSAAAELRALVLRELTALPPGTALDRDLLRARIGWRLPRRGGALRDQLVDGTLTEAAWLGVTGLDAVSSFGRLLANGEPDQATDTLHAALPEPIDQVLMQADLTAVAPGPLTPELSRLFALVADVESSGAGTVYRFSPGSVRRALDSGMAAADLQDALARHSRTPVPQPLHYLIDDVARRHGRIRVGIAGAYLRCDDDTVATELLTERRLGPLRLRRLAPGVLVTDLPADQAITLLREAGHAPAAETADGTVVIAGRATSRAPAVPTPEPVLDEPRLPSQDTIAAALRMLRTGDQAADLTPAQLAALEAAGPDVPRLGVTEVLVELLQAAADERSLWIGYVDADGHASRRLIDPIRVADGTVTAYDHLRAAPRSFVLHRITGLVHADT
jgi:hypothetical protein